MATPYSGLAMTLLAGYFFLNLLGNLNGNYYNNTITHFMSQLQAKIEAHTIEIKRIKTCIAELPNNCTILLKNSEEKMQEIQVQKENHHTSM